MRDTLPQLSRITFPPLRRGPLATLQANLGYRCNQSCFHCHVAASPKRTEQMGQETMELLLRFAREQGIATLDLTGGAPELNPHFRELVLRACRQGLRVMDRCNLTILEEPGQADLAAFQASQQLEVVASLPCYLEENVDRQRGDGVFAASLAGLRRLNALGYGQPGGNLTLNLVYNPAGASLPAGQLAMESAYREQLATRYGNLINHQNEHANMPIQRFGSQLVSRGELEGYMALLQSAHREENLANVMCRSMVSVDWRGYVYDCDFNQMLGLPLGGATGPTHLSALLGQDLGGAPIRVAGHCYGCTAGQGSSCGGALEAAPTAAATA